MTGAKNLTFRYDCPSMSTTLRQAYCSHCDAVTEQRYRIGADAEETRAGESGDNGQYWECVACGSHSPAE
jgi:hypothetical protein